MKLSKLKNLMETAESVAKNSHDVETKVGGLLVGKQGELILASYNGFVIGADDDSLPKTRPEKYPILIHCEANAIYQAARRGISIDGCSMVCTLSPCVSCCRALWQSGVRTIYFKEFYRDFDSQKELKDLDLKVEKYGQYYKLELKLVNHAKKQRYVKTKRDSKTTKG